MRVRYRIQKYLLYIGLFLLIIFLLNKEKTEDVGVKKMWFALLEKSIASTNFATFVSVYSGEQYIEPDMFFYSQNSILYKEAMKEQKEFREEDIEKSCDTICLTDEIQSQMANENAFAVAESKETENTENITRDTGSLDSAVQDAALQESVSGNFIARGEKMQLYEWGNFTDQKEVIKEFYAIDSTTSLKEGQVNVEEFLSKDMSLKKDVEGPQILIYHTHSQEAFADSVPGDVNTTIVGAGRKLEKLLEEQYGFQVLHHEGQYDVETRDYAYSNSLPEIQRILEENPSIEVVIDLHRDAMPEDTRLVTEIDGRKTAQFMFFNGLSYSNEQGDIAYLANPNIQENLAFSFQMQALCNEYYPGATRRIYLKGYRYNMHLKGKTLLVEMGAQNNTYEEISNAVDILAHVLYLCLSGEKP